MRLGESLGTMLFSTLPTVRSSSGPKDPSANTSALLLLLLLDLLLLLLGLDLLGLGIGTGAGVGFGVGFGVGAGVGNGVGDGVFGISVGNCETDGAGEGKYEGAEEIEG